MSDARRAIFSAISGNKKKIAMPCEKITHTIPLHARVPDRQLQALFEEKAIASSATIDHIGSLNELPDAVCRFLCDPGRRMKPQKALINHPLLTPLDWTRLSEASIDISADQTFLDAEVGITCAYCGIAETGSIVLLSETGVSSGAYFLPGVLIVVMPKDLIVPVQETAWAKVQRAYSRLPRTVTLVTGPSRTGDIEQKLVIGAHGPREVHMVLI